MSPAAHFLAGWLCANASGGFDRRAYWCITGAALAPDLDGLGWPVEYISDGRLTWYTDWHHVLGHTVLLLPAVWAACWWATRRQRVAWLACAAFVSHLLMDFAGSGVPDGEIWTSHLLWPLTDWAWAPWWQWPLNHPVNSLIILAMQVVMLVLAHRRGFSRLALFSAAWDRMAFATVGRLLRRSASRPS